MSLYEANGIVSHFFRYDLLYKSCISRHWNSAGILCQQSAISGKINHLTTIFRMHVQAIEHIESFKWSIYLQGTPLHKCRVTSAFIRKWAIRTIEQKEHYSIKLCLPEYLGSGDQVACENHVDVEYLAVFLSFTEFGRFKLFLLPISTFSRNFKRLFLRLSQSPSFYSRHSMLIDQGFIVLNHYSDFENYDGSSCFFLFFNHYKDVLP